MRCWRSCWICDQHATERALKLFAPEWAKGGLRTGTFCWNSEQVRLARITSCVGATCGRPTGARPPLRAATGLPVWSVAGS
jgi:hypothetical protein